ncbi:N-formylglutamate deformylase [Burkholderia aenigmatica]|uniref:N-formylglutamate deformylase n=2 Tax=Burkholderiaceae TaxID=119060 RepID=A0ABY6Y7K6_9BURK|nr:N-formylglutamate deformylase [Burkholderia aenigmatica]VWD54732.1 N-formylglutamate deformylase [Burkholderia aenigmatica]
MSSSYVPAFEIRNARRNTIPVSATIPHRGPHVPPDIATRTIPKHARWLRNTDWFLADLYAFLPEVGTTTIVATHSRYVEDVNRDPRQAPWANR